MQLEALKRISGKLPKGAVFEMPRGVSRLLIVSGFAREVPPVALINTNAEVVTFNDMPLTVPASTRGRRSTRNTTESPA